MIKGISISNNATVVEDVITPITGLFNPIALDYDLREQYIYFVDGPSEHK